MFQIFSHNDTTFLRQRNKYLFGAANAVIFILAILLLFTAYFMSACGKYNMQIYPTISVKFILLLALANGPRQLNIIIFLLYIYTHICYEWRVQLNMRVTAQRRHAWG